MSREYVLMPNESIILKEAGIAHGGMMALYTDELMLTNLKIICTNKGMLGNVKEIFEYPLNQIKMYNGKPQAMVNKLSNGMPRLEVYFINGKVESFGFQSFGEGKIRQWIDAIGKLIGGETVEQASNYSSGSSVEHLKEAGRQVKKFGTDVLGALGLGSGSQKNGTESHGPERVSKKCASCSAPLVGNKGQVVRCKYCDTEQIL